EDGIRDFHVTGVQTCALPISVKFSHFSLFPYKFLPAKPWFKGYITKKHILLTCRNKYLSSFYQIYTIWCSIFIILHSDLNIFCRSEERRVGKECRSRWSQCHT